MKKIILLTDFSEDSLNAVNYGINLYQGQDAEFLLLYTYLEGTRRGMNSLKHTLRKDAEATLEQIKGELLKKYGNLNLSTACKRAECVDAVNSYVDNHEYSLVVLGLKGYSKLQKILVGSNANSIVYGAKCDVLVVPSNAVWKKPVEVAFAADFDQVNDINCMRGFREVVQQFESKLCVVDFGSSETAEAIKEREKLNSFFENQELDYYSIDSGHLHKGVVTFAQQHHVDLLSVVARTNNFFDRIMNRKTTHQLVLSSKLPMLALRDIK